MPLSFSMEMNNIIQQYLYTYNLAINPIQTNEVLSDEEEVGAKQTPKV